MESISELTTDIWRYRKKPFFSLISTLTLCDLWDIFYGYWEDWHILERRPCPMLEKNCNTWSWTGRLVHILNFHIYIDEITKTLKPTKEELIDSKLSFHHC